MGYIVYPVPVVDIGTPCRPNMGWSSKDDRFVYSGAIRSISSNAPLSKAVVWGHCGVVVEGFCNAMGLTTPLFREASWAVANVDVDGVILVLVVLVVVVCDSVLFEEGRPDDDDKGL